MAPALRPHRRKQTHWTERMWEPEIDRVRAAILVRRGDSEAAEESLRRALERARAQKAHSLELRAALDLHELLRGVGRSNEGRALVEYAIHPFGSESHQPEVARARSLVSAGPRPGNPKETEMSSNDPQLAWTDDQWNRVQVAAQEAARNARVASSFLPLVGPLPPSVTTVPAMRMTDEEIEQPERGEGRSAWPCMSTTCWTSRRSARTCTSRTPR